MSLPDNTQHGVFERYLTDQEEKQLTAFVKQFKDPLAQRDFYWMKFMVATGVRVGTMSRLTVGDAYKMIGEQRLIVRDEIAKRGKGYSSYMSTAAAKYLHKLIEIHKFMGGLGLLDSPLVLGRRADGLSIRSFQARIQMWTAKAGLNMQVTPHMLRHTCGKRVVERSTAKEPLRIAKAALGHRNINTTTIYTAPDKAEQAATMEAVAR